MSPDPGFARLGYEAQVRMVFEAAIREARKQLRQHFKAYPHAIPPPLISASTSAHALCTMKFTFREDEDGIPLHTEPNPELFRGGGPTR